MEKIGVKNIVYTDIATDGTLAGPNTAAMAEMASSVGMNVIASGGIGNLEHIRSLAPTGVEGVIVGKALYTGGVNLTDAVKYGKGEQI
jgi:phosphoribosylformimino-5-aminoimidazole carboxamide ribotide isomerase